MSGSFDPYHTWLGIAPKHQPPNLYRLLGIELYEDSADVIENAADRQMIHVRTFQSGKHSAECQQLLNEISSARVQLLDPAAKAEYDTRLRAELTPAAPPPPPQPPPAARQRSEPTIPAPLDAGELPQLAPLEEAPSADAQLKRIASDRVRKRKRKQAIAAAIIGMATVAAGIGVTALALIWISWGAPNREANGDPLADAGGSSSDTPPSPTTSQSPLSSIDRAAAAPHDARDNDPQQAPIGAAGATPSADAPDTKSPNPPNSDTEPSAGGRWRYLGSGAFVETGIMDWQFKNAPQELEAEFSGQSGRIWGTAKIDVMRVKRHTLDWFGRELRWEVATPEQTDARIIVDSKYTDKPALELFLEAADGKRTVPFHLLSAAHEEVFVVAEPGGDVLVHSTARPQSLARLRQPDYPLTIRLAGMVRNRGDKADSAFRIVEIDAETKRRLLANVAAPPPIPRWSFLGVGARVGSFRELWGSEDAPRELNAHFDGQSGRINGEAKFDVLKINDQTVGWFGKELHWQVDAAADLDARLLFESKHLANQSRGPRARLEVESGDGRSITIWLLANQQEEITIRASEDGDVVARKASQPSPVERLTRPTYPLTLKLEGSVRNPREKLDSRFRIERIDSTDSPKL